jgi:hypothetical protein
MPIGEENIGPFVMARVLMSQDRGGHWSPTTRSVEGENGIHRVFQGVQVRAAQVLVERIADPRPGLRASENTRILEVGEQWLGPVLLIGQVPVMILGVHEDGHADLLQVAEALVPLRLRPRDLKGFQQARPKTGPALLSAG